MENIAKNFPIVKKLTWQIVWMGKINQLSICIFVQKHIHHLIHPSKIPDGLIKWIHLKQVLKKTAMEASNPILRNGGQKISSAQYSKIFKFLLSSLKEGISS